MEKIFKIIFVFLLMLTFNSCNDDRLQNVNEQQTSNGIMHKLSSYSNVEVKIDSTVTKDNSIVFDTKEEAENFVEDIRNELENNNAITYARACSPGVYSGTAWTTGFTSLMFDVSVGEGGCISGIHGYISGVGIPYSWSGVLLHSDALQELLVEA